MNTQPGNTYTGLSSDHAPVRARRQSRTESIASNDRLERFWAWASLLVLIVSWDTALRLDQHVSLPRMRIAHMVELEHSVQGTHSHE